MLKLIKRVPGLLILTLIALYAVTFILIAFGIVTWPIHTIAWLCDRTGDGLLRVNDRLESITWTRRALHAGWEGTVVEYQANVEAERDLKVQRAKERACAAAQALVDPPVKRKRKPATVDAGI